MNNLTLNQLADLAEDGQTLQNEQVSTAADLLASPEPHPADKERFLLALADKGETAAEIAALAARFRELARDPGLEDLARGAIDVCGTGGDHSGSFNVSTFTAFVLAAAGVRVLKHGNRSVTSKCGSADLLEGVGIRLDAPPDLLRAAAEELNFTFLFAPGFHPAFKEIIPVRKALAERGRRTVFNLLGPLLNPARPDFQLLGVFCPDLVEPLAATLGALGLRRGLVVHGKLSDERGMDELTCVGTNRLAGFGELADFHKIDTPPDAFGLSHCPESDLAGGDLETNLALIDALFEGKAPKGLLHTISANAGTALFITEEARDLAEGAALAQELILGGTVRDWLSRAKTFYAEQAYDSK